MGQELECSARIGSKEQSGRAQLESDHLLWRGRERLKIPFKEMSSVHAGDGTLTIVHPGGRIELALGARAAKWADKILHPPSLLDKLGVKPAQRVFLTGEVPDGFPEELEGRSVAVTTRPSAGSLDLLFLFADSARGLGRVGSLRNKLKPDGSLWIVYPKGRKELTENEVLIGGRDAGLKDTKVASFSPTHTALRFVIPVEDRPRSRTR